MAVDLRTSELENAFVKERISNIEKNINTICSKLSNYNKKLILLKDSGNDLAKGLKDFVLKETLNQYSSSAIQEFSDIIVSLQNERDTQIHRIDAYAIQELVNYGPICKKTKDDFKRTHEAKMLDIKKQNQLTKLQAKTPPDLQKIVQANKEANLAREEAANAAHEMSQKLHSFERKKLENIKQILLDFIKIEMLFYVKAIEMYTTAYNIIKNIKVEEDINEFMCHYKALTATLDELCISSCNTNIQISPRKEDNSERNVENQRTSQTLSASNTHFLKLSYANSTLKNTSESNFNFGDETL